MCLTQSGSRLTLRDLSFRRELAEQAVHIAVRRHSELMTKPQMIREKGDRDLVTAADVEVEATIRDHLARHDPNTSFVGEELHSGGGPQEEGWVLDPVDGTSNLVAGIPLWCISLAFYSGGRPAIGVVCHVPFKEMYCAMVGDGAYVNGTRLAVSHRLSLQRAIVGVGDFATGAAAADANRIRHTFNILAATEVHRIRMIGSAALQLAWVASGRLGAAITFGNTIWDVSAGVVIAREAGASVFDQDGAEHTSASRFTFACPPCLKDPFLALVREAERDGGGIEFPQL